MLLLKAALYRVWTMGNRREVAICSAEPLNDFTCPLQMRKLKTQSSPFPLQETKISGKGLYLNIGLSTSKTYNFFF